MVDYACNAINHMRVSTVCVCIRLRGAAQVVCRRGGRDQLPNEIEASGVSFGSLHPERILQERSSAVLADAPTVVPVTAQAAGISMIILVLSISVADSARLNTYLSGSTIGQKARAELTGSRAQS